MSLVFVIPGDPIPWARPKPSSRGMYDSQKHLKMITKAHIEKQIPPKFKHYCGPLMMDIVFYLPLPVRKRGSHHEPLQPHYFTPDLSNLIKHIEDCCSTLLFQDDCLISVIQARKMYDNVSRTEFKFEEIKNDNRKEK